MAKITKTAVIGAGTMGSGIASHLANAGVPVVLLDVVPEGAANRNQVAETALRRLRASSPPAFMDPDYAKLITPGNVEDHLAWLAEADWIAEAVVERLEVKQALYGAIESVRKPGALVSSNTSTLPLAMLTEGMPASLVPDFCITHFFNPVRYMRLLEMVAGPETRPEVIETLSEFCDLSLGKGVVHCKDTPGFLANRIGCFALQVAMVEALDLGLSVEAADRIMGRPMGIPKTGADRIMGRPMGIPKTGVFGLYDLIGLDLMLDVCRSLSRALPAGDAFLDVAEGIPVTHKLVAEGQTGRKCGRRRVLSFRRVQGHGGPGGDGSDERPVPPGPAASKRGRGGGRNSWPARPGRVAGQARPIRLAGAGPHADLCRVPDPRRHRRSRRDRPGHEAWLQLDPWALRDDRLPRCGLVSRAA
jgi:3-hydroxyacyl-CoA dehydrogenase